VRDLFTDRVDHKFLPPYSCALNPIEKLWCVIKNQWRRKMIEYSEGMDNTEMLRVLTELIE